MIDEKDIMVPMSDGVRVALRVYRPSGPGPFPTLYASSPYRYDNNELPATPLFLWRETGPIEWYVSQGYAYVHADVRGTGMSEGEYALADRREQRDHYEVIDWIARQSWSSGKVGGIGQSYYCISQWFMAIQAHPALACIAAYDGGVDLYHCKRAARRHRVAIPRSLVQQQRPHRQSFPRQRRDAESAAARHRLRDHAAPAL